MTIAVRCFAYPGVIPALLGAQTQLQTGSVLVLKQPYAASAVLAASTGAPVGATISPPNYQGPLILRVEVQKGSVVHVEVAGPNAPAPVATVNSPTIEGHELLDWGSGYQISVLQAGSEA